MKNKPMVIFTLCIGITLLFLSGCMEGNIYKQYLQAQENTDKIQQSSSLATFDLSLDLEGAGLSEEAKKDLDMFSSMKGSFLVKSDVANSLLYLDGHIDLKNMGFDVKIYSNPEQVVLLMPVFSKYMIIPQKVLKDLENIDLPEGDPRLGEEIAALWNTTVNKNNISKTGIKTVETYEGTVKATEFSLSLQEQEVKALMTNVFHLISTNAEFRNAMIESFRSMHKDQSISDRELAARYDGFILQAKAAMDTIEIRDFTYSGAYDKDLYIIEENMSHVMKIPTHTDNFLQVNYQFSLKRWDINKPVHIEMPSLNPSNSFTIRELEQNLPKIFESYIKDLKAGKE